MTSYNPSAIWLLNLSLFYWEYAVRFYITSFCYKQTTADNKIYSLKHLSQQAVTIFISYIFLSMCVCKKLSKIPFLSLLKRNSIEMFRPYLPI